MTDRGNIVIVQRDKRYSCLHTRELGSHIFYMLASALKRGLERWEHDEYLARIIFCEMVRGYESDPGRFGISARLLDSDHPALVVNVADQQIYMAENKALDKPVARIWAFKEFARLMPTPSWYRCEPDDLSSAVDLILYRLQVGKPFGSLEFCDRNHDCQFLLEESMDMDGERKSNFYERRQVYECAVDLLVENGLVELNMHSGPDADVQPEYNAVLTETGTRCRRVDFDEYPRKLLVHISERLPADSWPTGSLVRNWGGRDVPELCPRLSS